MYTYSALNTVLDVCDGLRTSEAVGSLVGLEVGLVDRGRSGSKCVVDVGHSSRGQSALVVTVTSSGSDVLSSGNKTISDRAPFKSVESSAADSLRW